MKYPIGDTVKVVALPGHVPDIMLGREYRVSSYNEEDTAYLLDGWYFNEEHVETPVVGSYEYQKDDTYILITSKNFKDSINDVNEQIRKTPNYKVVSEPGITIPVSKIEVYTLLKKEGSDYSVVK